jgi:mRNA interferase MazF
VWIADLEPVVGHEQGGRRPVLVISSDRLHAVPSGLVVVVPITRRVRGIRSHIPIQPPEGGLTNTSFVVTEQPRTISRQRLGRHLGTVSPGTLDAVTHYVRWFLDM